MKLPEIREVEDPASPAVAFTENGRTVVEVDAKLKGKERAAAILAACRAHELGLGGLIAVPLLAAWEPLKRFTTEQPRLVLAAGASTGGAALVSAGVMTLALSSPSGTHQAESIPAQTTISRPSTAAAGPSTRVRPPTTTPSPRRTPKAVAAAPTHKPDTGRTQAASSITRPATRPPATSSPMATSPAQSQRPRTPSVTPTREPAPGSKPPSTPPVQERPTQRRTPPQARVTPPRATPGTPARTPGPPPQVPSPGRDCLVEVRLPPVAQAGLLC